MTITMNSFIKWVAYLHLVLRLGLSLHTFLLPHSVSESVYLVGWLHFLLLD